MAHSHKGGYTKEQTEALKKKGVKPGTKKAHGITKGKAKEILRHGEVKGKTLTKKQKGFFGARVSGLPIIKGSYSS